MGSRILDRIYASSEKRELQNSGISAISLKYVFLNICVDSHYNAVLTCFGYVHDVYLSDYSLVKSNFVWTGRWGRGHKRTEKHFSG